MKQAIDRLAAEGKTLSRARVKKFCQKYDVKKNYSGFYDITEADFQKLISRIGTHGKEPNVRTKD